MTNVADQAPDPAFTIPNKPVSEMRVAIVTTAALRLADQDKFTGGDQSFRVLPPTTSGLILGQISPNFDRSGFIIDPNVVFPIDRLKDMAAEGSIGSVASRHIAFLGAQGESLSTIILDTGPAAAKVLKDDGVDLVLLTPVWPQCTRTGGTLARVFEEAGLITVQLSSTRSQSEAVRPPRALYCNFPLGRPLGKPNDVVYQRNVLDAAFELLKRGDGPVLEDFPDVIEGEADMPLACPLPPVNDATLPRAVDEARALRPAYDRQLAATGRTVVGKIFVPDQIPDVVGMFVLVAKSEVPWEELKTLGVPRLLAQDVRGYYEEAAMALADHVPGANQAEAWFFRKTAAGEALCQTAIKMRDGGASQADWGFLVPRVYLQ